MADASAEILAGCALDNGVIVAADSTRPDYPASAENYFYSWGRDAAYQIVAADTAQIHGAADIRRRYISWLLERCQGFSENGVLIKRYAPSGALDWRYGTEYQPDQAGALMWALDKTTPDPDKPTDQALRLMANGLSRNWHGRNFSVPTQDLWENRLANPAKGENFTYSLGMAALGLNSAINRLANQGLDNERDLWTKTRSEMLAVMNSEQREHYSKKIIQGDQSEEVMDASLSALAYPLDGLEGTTNSHQKRLATIKAIGHELLTPSGIIRYHGDTYDGIVRDSGEEATAGAWPLLTFWYAASLTVSGQRPQAREVFDEMVDRLNYRYQAR
ncbi:MAG: glycoside hydrolase family 15 protein, partial [Candidatus Micrarchaeaceae archaeon]